MDQGLWEALLAHRERLLALALSRGVSADDANDVVQEAMLRTAEYELLDLDRLPQFLTTVTIHLCADVHRRGKEPQRAKRWLTPLLHDEPDPADVVCRDHGPEWVEALVGRLPEKQRHVIVDRARGLSVQQIATRHRLTYKAAESALARARAALRSAVATSWSVAAFLTRKTRGCDQSLTASAAAAFVMTAALVGTGPSAQVHEPAVAVALDAPATRPAARVVATAALAPRPHPAPQPRPAIRVAANPIVPAAPLVRCQVGPVQCHGSRGGDPKTTVERIQDCVEYILGVPQTIKCRLS